MVYSVIDKVRGSATICINVRRTITASLAALLCIAVIKTSVAAPAAGDVYVYRVINGYSGEVRGNMEYRVDGVDARTITMSVVPQSNLLMEPHTEVYTPDGNWLRHPIVNHGVPVEYEFNPPYPAYEFPLSTEKRWSTRVNATNPANGARANVRVDGAVIGSERVTVPAGTFDTIKVRRYVYAGDWDGFRQPTNITETDWYAPALGRPVRREYTSQYIDLGRSRGKGSQWTHGDWTVQELVSVAAATP